VSLSIRVRRGELWPAFESFGPDELYLRVRVSYKWIIIGSPSRLSEKYVACANHQDKNRKKVSHIFGATI
jgi:hypothetical protein